MATRTAQSRSHAVLPAHELMPGARLRPVHGAIYQYWLEKCGGRRMPARADIDPVDMPKGLLPGLCLVDVVADERRYVYRLVGTADAEVRGYDPTGKSVIEGFFGPSVDDVLANYARVVSDRAPHIDPQHFVELPAAM